MNESQVNRTWQQFSELLRSEHAGAGLHRIYPPGAAACSFLDALQRSDVADTAEQLQIGERLHASISALLARLSVFENLGRCPVLAITGLLNAGKSSLLATYLSPRNRRRVLRGLGNQAGTHRFVLWLPEIWREDAELLSTLISYLTSLCGHAPESLSEDVELAALQYNGQILHQYTPQQDAEHRPASSTPVDPLAVPLIAYDEQLDELKLGLMDCPDIQTGYLTSTAGPALPLGDDSFQPTLPVGTLSQDSRHQILHGMDTSLTKHRRDQLARIGRLCSAFVVVSRMNSLHDDGLLQILSTLRDAMPGVPRFLAINRLKARYAPDVAYAEARNLVDRFGISSVYVAYDYRSSLAASRVPPRPSRWAAWEAEDQQPIFFEAVPAGTAGEPTAASTQPEEGSPVTYLFNLGDRLDAGMLSRETARSLTLQLSAQVGELADWLVENRRLTAGRLHDGWQAVADACYEFMAERDADGRPVGLRLQASPAIVAQMADSLQRTAPAWMQLSLRIDRTMRHFHRALTDAAGRFKILQSTSESVKQFAKKFRRGEGAQVVTPTQLGDALLRADLHESLSRIAGDELYARCEAAMKRFALEDQTLLNESQLDEWSRQIWSGMSLKSKLWKGTQPLAVITAPLLAAILVPFDGGGTAVLVFASVKELLAAAGIAAVMTPMATGGEALQIVQRETPWRQMSDLFAILCDCLGLPRPAESELPLAACDHTPRRLLASRLEVKVSTLHAAVNVWEMNEESLQQLQLAVRRTPRDD